MTMLRHARFPALLSALVALSGCTDCGGPLPDGGTGADGGSVIDGGDPLVDAGVDAGVPPGDGGPDGEDAGDNGLAPFSYATACDVNAAPAGAASLGVVDAFPGLTFNDPLFMTPLPGSTRLVVIEQGGMVYSFEPSDPANSKAPLLDLPQAILDYSSGSFSGGGERGLLGIAFHPDFTTNSTFYLSYTKRDDDAESVEQLYSILSRFTMSSASSNTADPASEYEILRELQPYGNHNGGMIAFGPDGYLYMGLGDGGDGGDPHGHGQDTKTRLGSLLRIDVDNEDAPARYSIPADNPFADGAGGNRPEIFAWGLRNPWRFSFDRASGDLWIADVGQGTWEEVNHVPHATWSAGGAQLNFGWNVFEGFSCYEPPEGEADCSGVTDTWAPDVVYHHDEGLSITGGYAYRGGSMPQHAGKYFYADYVSRSVWVFDPTTNSGGDVPAFTAPENVSSFAEDADGELYLLGYQSNGHIWRVVDNGSEPGEPPATLSETGCFSDLTTLTPVSGVVPYDVTMPLWSDGAAKERWLVLPPGGTIELDPSAKWRFPVGTLLIKLFAMDTTWGDPSTRVRLETRFIVVEPDGVRGFTYRWRDDGSDADLLSGGDTRDLQLTLEEGATPVSYSWSFPSPGQCQQCHTPASGGVLGLESAQLNREHGYGDVVINQLEAFATWGLFDGGAAPNPAVHASFPSLTDESADVAERARAWLHVNCAQCHLPGGPTGRAMDLRYTTPLADMNACDVLPQGPDFAIPGVRIIKPGDPDASLLHYRDNNAVGRMPPLGTTLISEEARAVQRQWIEALEGCTE